MKVWIAAAMTVLGVACTRFSPYLCAESVASKPEVLFVNPVAPPEVRSQRPDSYGYEQYALNAASKDEWIDVSGMTVGYITLDKNRIAPCYYTRIKGKLVAYQWQGVTIAREDNPVEYAPYGGSSLLSEKPDRVIEVIPAVQFLKRDNGEKVQVGYLDANYYRFYAFSDVEVPIAVVPPASTEHRWPVVTQRSPGGVWIEVKTISTPSRYVKDLSRWTRKTETQTKRS